MSEMTQQKQVTILLAVVAVLLATIIGIIVYQSTAIPEPTVTGTGGAATTAADEPAQTMPPTTGQPTAAGDAEFDPATAPKVPADQTPEQYVSAYYQLCQDGEFETAFPMLPTSTQVNSYGDAATFAAQLTGYGITGSSVQPQVEQDGKIYVTGTQNTPQMDISYTWTFVQGDDGSWLCAGRQMGGM